MSAAQRGGCAVGTGCFGHPDCEDRQCPGHPDNNGGNGARWRPEELQQQCPGHLDNNGGNGARWRLEELRRQDEQAAESEALLRDLARAVSIVAIAGVAGVLMAAFFAGVFLGARP